MPSRDTINKHTFHILTVIPALVTSHPTATSTDSTISVLLFSYIYPIVFILVFSSFFVFSNQLIIVNCSLVILWNTLFVLSNWVFKFRIFLEYENSRWVLIGMTAVLVIPSIVFSVMAIRLYRRQLAQRTNPSFTVN